jgi:hypothetical protein
MIGADPYYGRQEISNSDLSELRKYFLPSSVVYDLQQAYRFGNLVDALITEPWRCDHLRMRVDDEQFTSEEWNKATKMLSVFRKHPLCAQMLKMASGQAVKSHPEFAINYEGIDFTLPVRAKYDLWMEKLKYGGDIKSTVCTSQNQFIDSLSYFDYDRQRAWYMDISGAEKDVLIGISKVNFQVFVVTIDRNHWIYKQGKEKYQELAFRWYYLFSDNILKTIAA